MTYYKHVLISMLYLSFGCCSILNATPDKATWKREIFIGYNETHYFSYLIARDQPGLYYTYTDITYLCKYPINSRKVEEKILVRRIIYKELYDEKKNTRTWQHQEEIQNPINTEEYLLKNNVCYAFPDSSLLNPNQVMINKDGMFLQGKTKKVILLTPKQLQNYMDVEKLDYSQARIETCYNNETFYFFIVLYGDCCYDTDWLQTIIIIDSSEIENAMHQLH
ncbi:MAG: hypothetical protein WC955_01145 [Elusimicrobiota bacterium]